MSLVPAVLFWFVSADKEHHDSKVELFISMQRDSDSIVKFVNSSNEYSVNDLAQCSQ